VFGRSKRELVPHAWCWAVRKRWGDAGKGFLRLVRGWFLRGYGGWLARCCFTVWLCFFPSLFVFYVLFILPSVTVFFSPSLIEYFDFLKYKTPAAFFPSFLVGINLYVCPSTSFRSSLIVFAHRYIVSVALPPRSFLALGSSIPQLPPTNSLPPPPQNHTSPLPPPPSPLPHPFRTNTHGHRSAAMYRKSTKLQYTHMQERRQNTICGKIRL